MIIRLLQLGIIIQNMIPKKPIEESIIYMCLNSYALILAKPLYSLIVSGKLDCTILLTPSNNQSFAIEAEGTNSAGDFGIAGKFGYTHRNAFTGGEKFGLQLRASNEAIGSIRNILSYSAWEIGGETTLQFPRLMFPFVDRDFQRNSNANTEFNLNYSYQTRPDFARTIAGIGVKIQMG